MYPSGKSYLFDLGVGHWNEGSLTWFVTVWSRRGIVFDEIYGVRHPVTTHPAEAGRTLGEILRHRRSSAPQKLSTSRC
jgi:hypothetical protein